MRKVVASTVMALFLIGCHPPPKSTSPKWRFPPEYIQVMMTVKFMHGAMVREDWRMPTSKMNCAWAMVAATEFNQARAEGDYQRIIVGCYWPRSDKKA